MYILNNNIILGEDDELMYSIALISLSIRSPSLTIQSRSLGNSGGFRVRF